MVQIVDFGRRDQDFLRRLLKAGIDMPSIYDIGASNGVWSWMMSDVVPHATFELFEPHPSEQYADTLAQVLKARPGFRMHRVALGNQDTTLRLNVHTDHTGATLIDSDWEGVVAKKPVPVRRLDSLVAEIGLAPPDVIKMDVQGFELKILQGAEVTCRRAKALLLETWLYRVYGPETPLLGELVEWLQPRGFILVDMGDAWISPEMKLSAIDAYFLRTDIAEKLVAHENG